MTAEAQQIAIHEARGFDMTHTKEALEHFRDRDGYPDAIFQLAKVPDYLNDLNAMHEAEKVLTPEQRVQYRIWLILNSDGRKAVFPSVEAAMCHATAAQRAEAFLGTLGLWK
jgi:hypothetical protein